MNDFCVLLYDLLQTDAHALADHLSRYGIYRGDTLRALRRNRGVLMDNLDELRADNLAEGLQDYGIPCAIAPRGEVFPTRPRLAPRVVLEEDAVMLPHLEAIGQQGRIPLGQIRVMLAGLVLDSTAHSLQEVEPKIMAGETSHSDHTQLARQSFEKARLTHFPLHYYLLQRPEETVNMERLSGTAKRPPTKRKIRVLRSSASGAQETPQARRFTGEHPNMIARLYLVTDHDTWCIEADQAVWDRNSEATAGHWIRPLHHFCSSLTDRLVPPPTQQGALARPQREAVGKSAEEVAPRAEEKRPFEEVATNAAGFEALLPADHEAAQLVIPFDTLAFVRGFDQAPYLFEDAHSVYEYARWLKWRLEAQI